MNALMMTAALFAAAHPGNAAELDALFRAQRAELVVELREHTEDQLQLEVTRMLAAQASERAETAVAAR